jgi:glycerol-3-phosphate acyltransferase PlsY
LIAVTTGYLIGSISGARIVGRLLLGEDPVDMRVVVDGTGASTPARGVSPSTLFARTGIRGGVSASVIDILKGFLPVLAAGLMFPGEPIRVLVAAAVVLGHVFPCYFRFRGGFGISPLLGSLLAIDPVGLIAAIALFGLAGLILGNAYVAIEAWPLGLVVWFWIFGSPWELGFAVFVNVLFWSRSWREAAVAVKSYVADTRPWRERVADFKKYPDYEAP